MNLASALIGGIIGGAIGAAIWIGFGYVTGYELGWIAWGVGLLCGFGVYKGAAGRAGQAGGVLAAVLAIAAIVGAKYLLMDFTLRSMIHTAGATTIADMPSVTDRDFWIAMVCDEIATERIAAGVNPGWNQIDDPPAALRAEAAPRWDGMSATEKAAYRNRSAATAGAHMQDFLQELRAEMSGSGFFTTFGPVDLIFGVLAVLSAFKLGSMASAHSTDRTAMPA